MRDEAGYREQGNVMALLRLNDLNSHYRHAFGGQDIQQFQVYTRRNELVGTIVDALVDEAGRVQYLILNLHPAIANKQVVLPFDHSRIDLNARRVHLDRLSLSEAGQLPTYHAATASPSSVPPQSSTGAPTAARASVSRTHHPTVLEGSAPLETSTPLESPTPLEGWGTVQPAPIPSGMAPPVISDLVGDEHPPIETTAPIGDIRQTVAEPISTHNLNVVEQEAVRLLEERLFVNRQKRKVGEVIVRKEIETRIVEVPVRRERLIVEQVSPERKQLASIDLGHRDLDGVELRQAGDAESASVVRKEFASPEAASQFLQGIAAHPNAGHGTVQVTIVVTQPDVDPMQPH